MALAAMLLSSCDPGSPRTIGVYGNGASVHIVSAPLCPAERILGITVFAVQGNVIGDSNDEILWKVEGSTGSRNTDIIMGESPLGLTESKAFSGQVPTDSMLAAVVDTTLTQRLTLTFEVSSLRSDEVLTEDGYVALATFSTAQPSGCPG